MERWKKEAYPAIRAEAEAAGAVIYFADEAGHPLGLPRGHHLVAGRADAGGEEHREPVLGEHDLRGLGERRAAVRGL